MMLGVKAFTFNPLQENTYVVYNEKNECCIIDPGCYFEEEREELKTVIAKSGWKPVLLLNTHCHLDHVFGNQFIYDTWGLPLHIHEKEKALLDLAPQFGTMWQLPFDGYAGPVEYIQEDSLIKVGEAELAVRFTPGHSPGSVSFYHAAGNFIIGGDVLFNGSIGRADLPGGDFNLLIRTIQTEFLTLPDDTKVYSGHGPVTTIGIEKMNNPYVKMY